MLMEASAPPLAPLFTLHQFQKRSIMIVLVIYAAVLAIGFYIGTVWLENSLNQLTMVISELKDEVHREMDLLQNK